MPEIVKAYLFQPIFANEPAEMFGDIVGSEAMFENEDNFNWAELRDEEGHFFGSEPGKNKYLLIQYQGDIIGTISHTHNNGKLENLELDMWLRSAKYTGKGIEPAASKNLPAGSAFGPVAGKLLYFLSDSG